MEMIASYHRNLDESLQSWHAGLNRDDFSVIALGSYARREMARFSDVDMLLLIPDASETDIYVSVTQEIQALVRSSHIVCRTVKECAEMVSLDYRSWLALIESRFVCGKRELFRSLRSLLWMHMSKTTFQGVAEQFREYATNRERQYGDSVKLLEPNIKNSIGSLRDIHAMYHYGLVAWLELETRDLEEDLPTFQDIVSYLPLAPERKEHLVNASFFFLRVRDTMHTEVGYIHDTLEYDLQRRVAQFLGYGQQESKETVESFMRDYYAHSQQVRYAFDLLFISRDYESNFGEEFCVNDRFVQKGEILHRAGEDVPMTDVEIMEAFELYQMKGIEMGADIIRGIDDYLQYDTGIFSATSRDIFDKIIRRRGGVGKTLRRMNDLQILGALIPEFAALVHFFQHNIYHYYTVDEHTLIAIEHCETQQENESIIATVLEGIEDISTLYYAILFHDIAKPVDIPKHEIVGAGMAADILARFNRHDIVEDVQFLVRYHLMMEQVAFRRNYHDRTTIAGFGERVSTRQRLDLLFLLTYADLSALNPTVWTEWKCAVLQELRSITVDYLRVRNEENNTEWTKENREFHNVPGEKRIMDYVPEDEEKRQLSEEEQNAMERNDLNTSAVTLFSDKDFYTEATVIGKDAPYFLARISAVFMSCDASIIHAKIETLVDDIAVDRFRLINIADGKALGIRQMQTIQKLMQDVWTGAVETEALYDRHRAKWKRRIQKEKNPSIVVGVDYHQHIAGSGQKQTIIDVFSPDTFGLLYKLTELISSFRLNILYAKIATRVDGIVDSFYVTTFDGRPFDSAEDQEALRNALIERIHRISTRQ